MISRTLPLVVTLVMLLLAPGGGSAAAQELLHGLPVYDSGWMSFPPDDDVVVSHGLGGEPGQYVVDLLVRDVVDGVGGGEYRVHQIGLGGDDKGGFWWENLTSSQIRVRRVDGDERADQFRVRIWVVPSAAYDSGWVVFDSGQDVKWFNHNLGGAVADYVVDLQFNDFESLGCHISGMGRDQSWLGTRGAAWLFLDSFLVGVGRGTSDFGVDSFRLRIFRRPQPSYDSGWQPMSGAGSQLMHTLGGPWNDFVVDLQFRDTDESLGVNQVGLGGDEFWDISNTLVGSYGARWSHLTGRSASVQRNPDDGAADEIRVRIWESRRPKWDSGWLSFPQGVSSPRPHGLGGDPDTFVVDLQFRCTGDCWLGTTQKGYGMDQIYDGDSGSLQQYGAGWYDLTSNEITLFRTNWDEIAHQMRARIWIAPEAEYDIGWYDSQGVTGPLPFDVSWVPGFPSEWVVDLQGGDGGTASWGTNQVLLGTDNYTEDGTTTDRIGLAWTRLDSSSITIERAGDETMNARFRLRIWHNMAFDYISVWQPVSSSRTFSHDQGADPDDLLVDLHFKDLDVEAIHNLFYGGDRSSSAVNDRQGASWFALGSDTVSVAREPDDLLVDSVRMRVWHTHADANLIFQDGFESGDTSAW